MNQNFAAIILGGTGQVGGAVVAELLAIPECREVVMVTRKPIEARSRVRGVQAEFIGRCGSGAPGPVMQVDVNSWADSNDPAEQQQRRESHPTRGAYPAEAGDIRFGRNKAATEELRTAMIHYRALFDDLLQTSTAIEARVLA